jgi:hypothetical protein
LNAPCILSFTDIIIALKIETATTRSEIPVIAIVESIAAMHPYHAAAV